jgi:hypothetical protein
MYIEDLVAYKLLSVDLKVDIEELICYLRLDFFFVGMIKQSTRPPTMTTISCCGTKNSIITRNNSWSQ